MGGVVDFQPYPLQLHRIYYVGQMRGRIGTTIGFWLGVVGLLGLSSCLEHETELELETLPCEVSLEEIRRSELSTTDTCDLGSDSGRLGRTEIYIDLAYCVQPLDVNTAYVLVEYAFVDGRGNVLFSDNYIQPDPFLRFEPGSGRNYIILPTCIHFGEVERVDIDATFFYENGNNSTNTVTFSYQP